MMAAIAAGEKGAKVLLVEKGDKLGRKLAISGGGRCNVTNNLPVDEIIRHIPGNGRFLYSAFSVFNNKDIIAFFERLGVKLKEEDHGRMFPASNSSADVVNAMLEQLDRHKVKVFLNTPVKTVNYQNGQVSNVVLQNGQEYACDAVILAAGGKSVPQTGSTGDGYAWAKKAGHTITELYPTEVPLTSDEPFIKQKALQGLALRDVELSVLNPKGKALITHRMDMLFTHFGISGPAVLRCSQFVVKAKKKWNLDRVEMQIDSLPGLNQEELFQKLNGQIKEESKKTVKNIFKGLLPERYLHYLLEQAEIEDDIQGSTLSNEKLRRFVSLCKSFRFTVNGTLPLEKAFVTGGGVSVKEIQPKEMGSKLMEGLYFCGEILDIHGYTGGYNITSALVTGRLAGVNAAAYARSTTKS